MTAKLMEWQARGSADDVSPRPQHAGLWLNRCYTGDKDGNTGDKAKPMRESLFRIAIEALQPYAPAVRELYTPLYRRWREALGAPGPYRDTRVLELETTSRLLLHPNTGASPTDGAVLLHHTYGVPYLPGSGLKGVARAYARSRYPPEVVDNLFGPERADGSAEAERKDRGALVNFLDALWIPVAPPERPGWSALELDIVTPHHKDYYTKSDDRTTHPPGDWEEPVPIQRLTVSAGARFCAILEGCQAQPVDMRPWMQCAEEIFRGAVATLGFGAYTNAGYGRMRVLKPNPTATPTITASWGQGKVVLDPGSGRLSALLDGGRRAFAEGLQATALRASLPQNLQDRLKKQRELSAMNIRVEPIGTTLRIVELRAR